MAPFPPILDAASLVCCRLFVLPMIQYGINALGYGSAVLFSLLGLLLLNTTRHRAKRQRLLDIRRLRQAVVAQRKAR